MINWIEILEHFFSVPHPGNKSSDVICSVDYSTCKILFTLNVYIYCRFPCSRRSVLAVWMVNMKRDL